MENTCKSVRDIIRNIHIHRYNYDESADMIVWNAKTEDEKAKFVEIVECLYDLYETIDVDYEEHVVVITIPLK